MLSSVILDQINGIARLYMDGIITKQEAMDGAKETVKYYFGKNEDYAEYIGNVIK